MSRSLRILGEKPPEPVRTGDPESVQPRSYRGKAAVVTLGCAKNQVDSEVMLGVLAKQGFELVSSVEEADVAIVNTCGFLESAVKESIDCILDVSDLKHSGRLRKLIVAGCMVSRYGEDLQSTLPEVDNFVSLDDIMSIGEVAAPGSVSETLQQAARPYFLYDDTMPRYLSGRSHFAYVKISEGCNRPCTFCIIPKIRGPMRSRERASVVREVQSLAEQGVKEVNLVAQDLTNFGADTQDGRLVDLLADLNARGNMPWIRLLYAYPIGIDAELLSAISTLPHICEYLDLPLQHASESVLKRMKRPIGRYSPREIVKFIRETAPNIALRTTFIVGFPGETDSDIDELEAFVSEGHFSHVGVFCYSREAGTPSHDLEGQVAAKKKEDRRKRIMLAQQAVSNARLQQSKGSIQKVLLEGAHSDTDLLLTGRTRLQAPEVDGCVLINDMGPEFSNLEPGTFVHVEMTDSAGYDLIGKIVDSV